MSRCRSPYYSLVETKRQHLEEYATIFLLNLLYAVVLKTVQQRPAVILLDKYTTIIIIIIANITFIINMFNPFVCKIEICIARTHS